MKTADESADSNGQDAEHELEPLFVTAKELAQLMRISTRTLWRLLSARKVPEPIRLGAAVRWRIDVIQDWIDQGCPDQNK